MLLGDEASADQAFKDSPVVAENARLRTLADVFDFTEGPAADSEGNVYFTDQPNDRILIWTVDQTLRTFMKPSGRSNGLYFDREGKLIACADEKNELWRIDVKTKEKQVIVPDFDDKLLNGPNDAWVDPKGGIYFTDPYYKRGYWQRGDREQDGQHVYYLASESESPTRVVDDLFQQSVDSESVEIQNLDIVDNADEYSFDYLIQGE